MKAKKKVFTKNGTLFSPNSGGDLRSDENQSQIIGWVTDVDHTQIIGGIQSNYWGDISPHPPPPGFGTPGSQSHKSGFEVMVVFQHVRLALDRFVAVA